MTFRKVWNFCKVWVSFHISRIKGKARLRGNPVKIGIEPTTSCNLRCPECPSGLRSFTRPTGMLPLSDFKVIADTLHKDLVYMLFYFQGEPFLNPAFLEMVQYAGSRKIFTATSTNGHYLKEEMCRKTIESGLHEITISIDGATQETYEKYRVGGDLEKVKEGIRSLVRMKKELKSRRPFIILQFIVFKTNESEIPAIHQMGKELGVDRVAIKTAQIYDFEEGNELIPSNPKYSRYEKRADGKFHLRNKMKNQCWKMWMGAEITWDGRDLPCCFDKDGQYEMGRIGKHSFWDIWQNEPYQAFRNRLLQSRKDIEICRNCSEGTQIWG